ncbi:hypothetical protein [Fibrisoma limi]|uniref:hypothetical protein n=1 Tax=Fibrisoma limi TaxID=663275 RepID=UPI000587A1FB|nr:hypothetical protein [Fibrisoma limi]
MALQRILEADLMTHLLFLTGLITLAYVVLLEAKNQTKQLSSCNLNDELIGLYYQLESGVDLFICKANRGNARLIASLIKALEKRSADVRVRDIVDIDAFQKACGEAFDPVRLHTKLISSTTSVYPIYHNTGIVISNSDTKN